MTVAVVTPWFEHLELAPDYFRALDMGPPPDETIIIDNGSQPPLDFAAVRLDRNTGFSHASNVGLEHATADVVVFLNNDIAAARPGWLDDLAAAVEPGVLAGARLRYDDHCRVDGKRFPYLDGWCLAGMRDDLTDLGGFSEDLTEPGYYSDNLLCLEARVRGMRLREVQTGLRHKVGVTTGGPDRAVQAAILANYQVYAARTRALLEPLPA